MSTFKIVNNRRISMDDITEHSLINLYKHFVLIENRKDVSNIVRDAIKFYEKNIDNVKVNKIPKTITIKNRGIPMDETSERALMNLNNLFGKRGDIKKMSEIIRESIRVYENSLVGKDEQNIEEEV